MVLHESIHSYLQHRCFTAMKIPSSSTPRYWLWHKVVFLHPIPSRWFTVLLVRCSEDATMAGFGGFRVKFGERVERDLY
jgi:hypothetical protein